MVDFLPRKRRARAGSRSPHQTSWPWRSRSCARSEPVAPAPRMKIRMILANCITAPEKAACQTIRGYPELNCKVEGRTLCKLTPPPFAYGRDIPRRRGEASRERFAEGLGGNAQASRAVNFAALGKEPVSRKCVDFRLKPDSLCESGFLFLDWFSDEPLRQIRAADHRPADLRHGPLQFPVRLLPVCRSGKLSGSRRNSVLGGTQALGGDFRKFGDSQSADHGRRAAGARGRRRIHCASEGAWGAGFINHHERPPAGGAVRAVDRRGATAHPHQPGFAGCRQI